MKFMQNYGFNPENCIMCDSKGVIYKGRDKNINPYKARFQTNNNKKKTLEEAMVGADIAIGLSKAGLFTQ